jgi:redox-sensitive bicupin YhaK (pirin superfamily)
MELSMKVLSTTKSQPTQDGVGVNISRVADFSGKLLDPFLMIDEIKSDNEQDYIGGFPPHPHRGIETFTYMIKGGFEHQDQLGNKKIIGAGGVQWMSTGYGVIHSEMPVIGDDKQMHGFQIWLNMPAKDKLRPARYQDSANQPLPKISNKFGAQLTALAGSWQMENEEVHSPFQHLAGKGAIADVVIKSQGALTLDISHHQNVAIYIHSGSFSQYQAGDLLILDPKSQIEIETTAQGAGFLVLAGEPIREEIAHMGPFVMNTQAELKQAFLDYQNGKFGKIA